MPNGIAIDADDNIYISDSGNNRILKFDPIFPAAPETAVEEPIDDAPAEIEEPVEEEAPAEEEDSPNDNDTESESDPSPTPTNPPDDT